LQFSLTGRKVIKHALKGGYKDVLCSTSLELIEDKLEFKKLKIVTYKLSGMSVVFSTSSALPDLTLKMLSIEEKLDFAHKRLEILISRGNCGLGSPGAQSRYLWHFQDPNVKW
jgi:hypothetical protein